MLFCFRRSGADSRQDVVDADDAVGSGRAAVVHDGGVALYPHPAAVLGQEAVILGGDLSFHEHCGNRQALFVSGPGLDKRQS